jgi:hypothetical protein
VLITVALLQQLEFKKVKLRLMYYLSFFLSSSSAGGWFPSSVALISCLNPQKFEILQYLDVDQQKEKAPETCRCNCNKAGSSS